MNDIIEQLGQVRTFVTNSHKLANVLQIKDRDAEQLIITKLFSEYQSALDNFVMQAVRGDAKSLWHITFRTKDIIREHFSQESRQNIAADQLEYIDFSRGIDYVRQYELDKVIQIIPKIFRNKRTRQFVEMTLEFGEAETTAKLGIDRRRFHMKLCAVERYCRNNRQKFVGVAISKEEQDIMNELDSIDAMIKYLEADYYQDKFMAVRLRRLFDERDEALTNILDTPKIKRPLKMIVNFGDESIRQECYVFVDRLYERQDKLKRRLVNYETSSLL